jgi:hypothetical protein
MGRIFLDYLIKGEILFNIQVVCGSMHEVQSANYPEVRVISLAYCRVGGEWDLSDVSA